MNCYTSGKRIELGLPRANHDPEPWLSRTTGTLRYRVEPDDGWGYDYSPRPEFDVPDNPILARFRERIEETWEHPYWGDAWDSTMDYIDFASDFPYRVKETSAEIDHARRVLLKLAAVYA